MIPDRVELAGFLERCLGDVELVDAAPLADRSTHALVAITVRGRAGDRRYVLKDYAVPGFVSMAGLERPRFVADREREIEVYRELLSPGVQGVPPLAGAEVDPERERYWLLLGRVPGTPLWQHGDLGLWRATAAWLARFHARFDGEEWLRGERLPARLLRHDAELFRSWFGRARQFHEARANRDHGPGSFSALAHAAERALENLDRQPVTVLHGELYPSNVLVAPPRFGRGASALHVVDWEMAGVGAPALDVAALVSGRFRPEERRAIAGAYRDALPRDCSWRTGDAADWIERVERFRLLVDVQWLGWKRRPTPPAHQLHDWLADALEVAMRPGLAAAGG